MPIDSIVKTLSDTRLSTYKKDNLCDATIEQSLGLYVWNKQLSGLFYPVLQVLEISLRNAIYNAYIEDREQDVETNYPEEQWEAEKAKIDPLWFKNIYSLANNSIAYRQLQNAENDLHKEGKEITPDNLIAKLTFGFWVHMTDKKHRDGYVPTPIIALWPKLNRKVFPHAVDFNGHALSINNISSCLFSVNKLRNRIAHHEPIWKAIDLYDSDDAINKVVQQYDLCLKVIRWINPNNLKLLSIIENEKLMGIACSQHTLWRNKMLANGLSTVPDLTGWEDRHKIDTQRTGEVIKSSDTFALIRCEKSRTIFYTKKNLQKRKKAWPLVEGTKVYFMPKPSNSQYANAVQVKQ
ncbi:Abi family protein [Vibrio rotiferianus]|uniref:Abi family protein n=1 Tax=Vibrio rotiferianus TaxID=190895 RepID=UPI00406A5B0B